MASVVELSLVEFVAPEHGIAVVFADADLAVGSATAGVFPGLADLVARLAAIDGFKGKAYAALDVLAPAGTDLSRLIVVGLGKADEAGKLDWMKLGGTVAGRLPPGARGATVYMEGAASRPDAQAIADFCLGARLRSYAFDRYKTRKKDAEPELDRRSLALAVDGAVKTRKTQKVAEALADGVILARDLVNEPPNVLYPEEFATRAARLEKLGVEIEILDVKVMRKLGMGALLGVGQGSANDSRVVIMRWNGAKEEGGQPVAFVGKGVTFDTGGISIKPAASMEEMKGDMAGAACVVGLMHALAARKARVNVVGAIGLVENMPDGQAQRPGDIVRSLSGQTIEIINTDAEGRLVLADVLWYVQDRFKPKFMVDLATLTGAVLVALGQEYAGLFSNDDELAARLYEAGVATGEKVWRLPLTPEYDKLVDSRFADVKNSGGRMAGSITGAQFLQRFVNETPWAHLDIAGTALNSPSSETNRSWGAGWGVRLLDRLVSTHYED